MKLPDEFPETPYKAGAYRLHHRHVDDEDTSGFPGTFVLEFAASLPGTEAEFVLPVEMDVEMVIGLMDELIHQYRCVAYGLPEDDEDDELPDSEEP